MRFGSLFSGIEAASAGWLPLGWECAWVAEIDPFACAVLRHHYPDVPNLGDVNRIDPDAVEPVDLVVFGSPCQSFSVAGKRLGLDDPRGNMALVGLRVVGRIRPRWVVWENVPGVLSSDQGRDFGAFLGLLGELGYGFAYRILDAQHAGVPQRRRRVFVVGCLGDWRPAAAVLFESESLRGDPPPRREAGERIAPSLTVGAHGSSGHQYRQRGNEDALIAKCLEGHPGRRDYETETFVAATAPPCTSNPYGDHESREGLLIAFSAKDYGADAGDTAPTLRAGGHSASHANAGVMPAIAFQANAGRDFTADEDRSPPLRSDELGGGGRVAIAYDVTGVLATSGGRETEIHTALRSRAPGHSEASTTTVIAHSLRADTQTGRDQHAVVTLAIRGRGDSHDLEYREDGIANAVLTPNGGRAGIGVGAVAFAQNQRGELRTNPVAPPLTTGGGKPVEGYPAAMQGMSVRRLTPVECEKLQGFSPGYTDVPYRGKPASDGPRYRAIGNSMAVPVVAWIGRRLQQFTEQEATDAAE